MYLCVLLLIFGVFGNIAGQRYGDRNNYGNRNNYEDRNNNGTNRMRDLPLSYTVIGSDYREEKEDKWRPCCLDDYDCIGHFLADNSQCKPAQGYTPDPLNLPIEKYYFPSAGMTITQFDAKIRGFKDARVSEFYVNKATGNVVIAVSIPHYNLTANAYFSYQRTAQEPISLNGYDTFQTDAITLTAIIPKVNNLRLNLAEIYAKAPEVPPRYYIAPEASRSRDPAVKVGFRRFEENVVQAVKEASVVHSYYLMSTFIQKELCDFGLDSFRNNNGYFVFHRSY